MKKLFFLSLAALSIVSCNKQEVFNEVPVEIVRPDSMIVFTTPHEFSVTTKAVTAVTSLTSFNCIATTGNAETLKWGQTVFTGAGSPMVYTGGKYWPATDESYHFYASNVDLTYSTDGCTVNPANGNTDVVVAYKAAPTYRNSNELGFEHIFARLCSIQLTAQAPSNGGTPTVTINKITLKNGVTAGSYNLKSATWVPSSTKADIGLAHSTSNDVYIVPGTYTLEVNYVYTIGDYTKEFTKSSDVTLKKGCTNNISGTLSSDAKHIEFTVSVANWSNNGISVSL